MTNDRHTTARAAAAALLPATLLTLVSGTVVTATTETLGVLEVLDALWRCAPYLVLPVLLGTIVGALQRAALDAWRIRSPSSARWFGFAAIFVALTATLQFASYVLGLEGFFPWAIAAAMLGLWIATRFGGKLIAFDRPEAWALGVMFGGAVTLWVERTFELRHSILAPIMDSNAILLAACAGLSLLAGFALAGVLIARERTRANWIRAALCLVAAIALGWGNRVIVVPRLYLEAHLAIALFEWTLWVGALAWSATFRDVDTRKLQLAVGALLLLTVTSAVVPAGQGIRPQRLDYTAQIFARTLAWADLDDDGFLHTRLGGVDCGEGDALIHPFARERGGDENCTGAVESAPPRPPEPPSLPAADLVVVITIDTLRPDYMGIYGSELDTTPRLAAVQDWAIFEAAYTSGGITTLAVGSLLNGRLPLANDLSAVYRTVDRRYVFPDQREPGRRVNRVFHVPHDDSSPTIADTFTGAGRSAFAFVDDGASRVFQQGLGYERGFTHFTFPNSPEGPGEEKWDRASMTDAFVAAAPTLPPGAFVWLHYYDPHNATGECRRFERLGGLGCYADAIWDVDEQIGRAIDALRTANRWDDTLLIVTSDHGEALMEHGLSHHGLDSYEEFVHIPMLVRGPGVTPGTVKTPVSLIDASATAVAAGNIAVPSSFQGHDLRLTQRDQPRPLPVMSQLLITSVDGRPYRQQTLIVDGPLRHMWDRITHRAWTFDVAADPAQQNPHRGESAALVKRWIDVVEAQAENKEPIILSTSSLRP